MIRYTFEVKGWETRQYSNIVKLFDDELNTEDIHRELSLLFDTGEYKNVMLKSVAQVDEIGNVVKDIDWKKW